MSILPLSNHCYQSFASSNQKQLLVDCLWSEYLAVEPEKVEDSVENKDALQVNIYENSEIKKKSIVKRVIRKKTTDYIGRKVASLKMRAVSKAEGIIDYFTQESLNPFNIKDKELFEKFSDRYEAFSMVLRAENDIDRIHAREYIRRQDIINPVEYRDSLKYPNPSGGFLQAFNEVWTLSLGSFGFERS